MLPTAQPAALKVVIGLKNHEARIEL
jgi:hypothetical protein